MKGFQTLTVFVCLYFLRLLGSECSPLDESIALYNEEGYVRGFRTPANASDFHIGLLLDVYWAWSKGHCSYRFTSSSPKFVEAFLFSMDKINSQMDLLPNVTLGYDIRDYCASEVIAVNETLQWIECSLVSETCSTDQLSHEENSKFTAVVGAEGSFASLPVAGFLRVFSVPQVSYLSSSPVLSDKYLYPYFLRTVPPDTAQAQAMIDLVTSFGWEIISVIHSGESYGEHGVRVLRELASKAKVCIDLDVQIERDLDDKIFAQIATRLVNESVAEVVVVFSLANPMSRLLDQIEKLHTHRRFTWVVGDAITVENTLHQEYNQTLSGMFGFTPLTTLYFEFEEYFSKLNSSNNIRNPWFPEYYKQVLSVSDSSQHLQNFNVPLVVDAVYSIAHGLDNFLKENCDQPLVWNRTSQTCKGQMQELTGSILHGYIKNVTFLSPTNNTVFFDSNGDGKPAYSIFNLQYNGLFVENVKVGEWDSDNHLMFNSPQPKLQFGITHNGQIVTSRQSECTSCMEGSAQREVPTSCCTYCIPCLGSTYLNTSFPTLCTECGQLMWGNDPLNGSTACVPITQDYLHIEDIWGIVLLLLELIGSLLLVTVIIGIVVFWNNRVIKSFGREQLLLILVGLCICFLLPCLYLIKPSPAVCALQQIGLWFSLTIIFAALLVKLIRVTRIFLSPVIGRKLHFIAPWQQVVFTMVIVSGQMMLVIISLIVVKPGAKNDQQNDSEDSNNFPVIIITCQSPNTALLILQVIYETVLIILINAFGIFTIRFPENFNESKNIAFSTFAVGVVWMAFIPTYFATASDLQLQAATVALTLMIMAFCIIFCLISPRLYIALRSSTKMDISFSSKTTGTELNPSTKEKENTSI